MSVRMKFSIYLRRTLAAPVLLLTIASCAPIAAPAPRNETATPAQAVATPPLVAFPTAASETAVPPTTSLTSTLTSPSLAASLPIVQLVSPISNTQISISQTTYFVAFAADDNGIARIEFFDDQTLVKTETAPTPAPPID